MFCRQGHSKVDKKDSDDGCGQDASECHGGGFHHGSHIIMSRVRVLTLLTCDTGGGHARVG